MVVARTGKPFVLGKRGEEILRAVHFYRYMTALDVTHLFFSPSSLTHVRQILSSMCGGRDYAGEAYLYRFCLPGVALGNPERVYILGKWGREFLESEGLSVKWYFRPEKMRRLSYSQMIHNLSLTRFMVAARRWAGQSAAGFSLAEARICYELSAVSVDMEEKEGKEKIALVPDAWLYFEKQVRGKPEWFPVLVEIDRGTMFRERFKRHVLSRVEFVRSGGYRCMFGKEAVMIAYATTGAGGETSEGRSRVLCAWTREALKDVGKENWSQIFRFTSFSLGEIYMSAVFEDRVWYRPDRDEKVGLFEG